MTITLPPNPQFGEPLDLARAPDVLTFLARRRSVSAMTLTTPAPDAHDLDALLRLAVRAPDHGKLSPWRFVILQGPDKDRFAARLEALALGRNEASAAAKVAKLRVPPLAVAVISAPKPGAIPEWEQRLSAGAVCTTLLYAALAGGYGANWITDWYAYDADATAILGVRGDEKVAAFMLIGAAQEAPLERERPDLKALVSRWRDRS